MWRLFKKQTDTVDDIIRNRDCNALLERVSALYGKDMTGLIVIPMKENREGEKEGYLNTASIDTAQAILSLVQALHRVQHQGLEDD